MSATALVTVLVTAAPDDEDVVAGWTAFALFIGLIIAVALLGVSLTRRLKNVERAAEQGLYDPSTPRRRPARGLAATREMREPGSRGRGAYGRTGERVGSPARVNPERRATRTMNVEVGRLVRIRCSGPLVQ